jgi:hypothetical protein
MQTTQVKDFVDSLKEFVQKNEKISHRDQLTCENCFENVDNYKEEKELLAKIKAGVFENPTDQGNALERLIKSLFNKITLINSVKITNKETALGQIDIILIPLCGNLYDVWGLIGESPQGVIGECKNYGQNKSKNKVSRPEIEKSCWRACKGGCLSFFIGHEYTQDAIAEVAEYNSNKNLLCTKCQGAYIVPLKLYMIEAVVENDINFCYFIKWAIATSKTITSIANYL